MEFATAQFLEGSVKLALAGCCNGCTKRLFFTNASCTAVVVWFVCVSIIIVPRLALACGGTKRKHADHLSSCNSGAPTPAETQSKEHGIEERLPRTALVF